MHTMLLVFHAMRHGYQCWGEYHPYFADHSRGGWIEYLCRPR